jgi:hypothetical protein
MRIRVRIETNADQQHCDTLTGMMPIPNPSFSRTIVKKIWKYRLFVVPLHNGGFCNGFVTKRILLLQAFTS